MRLNFFKRNKPPTDKETKIVAKATAEADPTTYTTLPPDALEEVGRVSDELDDLYDYAIVEDKEGNRYIDMTEKFAKSGPTEQAVTSLLKGIINVSDVVAVSSEAGTKYYSKIVELEKTPNKTLQEMNADVALVETVFNDPDRSIAFGDQQDHNMVRNTKRTKVAYFDFGGIKSHFWREGYVARERAIGHLDYVGLSYMEDKLHALRERIEDTTFLESIIERSGQTVSELFWNMPVGTQSQDALILFKNTLIARIDEMLGYVANRKQVRKVA